MGQYFLKEERTSVERVNIFYVFYAHYSFYFFKPSSHASLWLKGKCIIVCFIEGPHFNSSLRLLNSITNRDISQQSYNRNPIVLQICMFVYLFLSRPLIFSVSVCCGNKGFMVCSDALFCWTLFKALGIDLHAALLPQDSRAFSHGYRDFV